MLLQTYQAEQAMQHTHANIARELRERQQEMEALEQFVSPRRFPFIGRMRGFSFVARFMRSPRFSIVGRLEH